MAAAWTFLTLEDADRVFQGNRGYADDIERHYSWDETVPQRDRVAEGDLAVIRDKDLVLGLGWIDRIERWRADKERLRCPGCASTGFKERLAMRPRYRCPRCRSEFDEPRIEVLTQIRCYRAYYDRTWVPMDGFVPVSSIETAYLGAAKQHAIRPVDMARLMKALGEAAPASSSLLPGGQGTPAAAPTQELAPSAASVGKMRFRQLLFERYGLNCAINGALPAAALDAVHLYRYATRKDVRPDSGLLLRRDLCALFDRRLLVIAPDDNWRVRINPKLSVYPTIWSMDGQPVRLAPQDRPKAEELMNHATLARMSW